MGNQTGEATATERSCPVYVVNNTGGTLSEITFTHRYDGDYKVSKTFTNLANGSKEYAFDAKYRTGFVTTGHDYWWVSFKADGHVFACKDNFYCYLMADDDGKDVLLKVTMNNFHVACPVSTSCDVAINQVG
ncbi:MULTISPECIES: hypothetical protein [Kitasatospora]|uniref:Up-regulated in Daf-2 domain-containing protein n=1 Tax=Kitasatospora cystarginea TaxID=58350 RepID=A0ABN3DSP5_9ACTN